MTANTACAVSDFLLACPLATPSTLELLEPKAVPGYPKSSDCDRRRSIQETIRTLLADGIIQKQVVPNLPRQFRRAEPVYARSVKFSETRLNYSVSAEICTRPVVPLVSRTVYFLTENAHLFNQLLIRHESARHNDDLAPDNLSPLAVVLRLANFFAEHSMLAGEKIEVPLILKGSVPQHWIGHCQHITCWAASVSFTRVRDGWRKHRMSSRRVQALVMPHTRTACKRYRIVV